jgi:hypothetical protein
VDVGVAEPPLRRSPARSHHTIAGCALPDGDGALAYREQAGARGGRARLRQARADGNRRRSGSSKRDEEAYVRHQRAGEDGSTEVDEESVWSAVEGDPQRATNVVEGYLDPAPADVHSELDTCARTSKRCAAGFA